MTTRLLIARHGNTFAPDELPRRVGITDLPLVDSGLAQGRLLGTYLKNNDLVPDVIFTSKLKRTIQTSEQAQRTMGTNLTIETLSLFNEIDYGPDENQPENQVVARLGKEAINAWETQAIVPKDWKVDPETLIKHWMDFSARLRHDFAGKICLVITSNGIARFSPYLTGDFANFSSQYNIKIATGALCLFEHNEASNVWKCNAWNVKP
ncbi:MAG: phosphoglycerate mutase family protein [Legionella longbeachae]|nr:phosphoglycerate mutase family protein [Legionella longbeachae]